MTSLNTICDLLKLMAKDHEQIRSYGEGDMFEIGNMSVTTYVDGVWTDKTDKGSYNYPLMWVIPQPSNTAKVSNGTAYLNLKLSLIFVDRVQADNTNEQEVLSDQMSTALDIFAQLNDPSYADNFIIEPNAPLTPFTDKFDDVTAGWKIDCTFRINYTRDRCAVPSALVPSPLTSGCAQVAVIDGVGVMHMIDSGGGYSCQTLPQLLGVSQASVIYSGLQSSVKLTSVIQVLQTNDLTVSLTSQQVTDFIQALTAVEIYNDLTGGQVAAIIALLTNIQLTTNLSGAQINAIIQSLTAATIYADMTAGQKAGIVPLFSAAEIDTNITTAQVTGLGASNVQKLVLAQIQNLINSQLLMLSTAQLIDVLDNVMSQQFINDNLSQATRNILNKRYPAKTGQTTSYANYDDGWFQAGSLGFGALPLKNQFNNNDRFTDIAGGQTYAVHYVIDHATGLGWAYDVQTAATWAAACAKYGVFSLSPGSFTYTDFRLPNEKELKGLDNYSLNIINGTLLYAPFNIALLTTLWTSSTNPDSANRLQAIRMQSQAYGVIDAPAVKTGTSTYILVRTHY